MCGICGFIDRGQSSEELLREMIDTIRYRGPDDRSSMLETLESGFRVGLAHRRLAILDLSAAGRQPMNSESGRTVISFNGEIYNYRELRAKLEQKGYRFRTGTDTEVILSACEAWGIDAVQRFNGMFAFALFDREAQSLYLVRDRMGVKPLYYYTDGDTLVFASELKPIMKYPGFRKEIDRNALTMYLAAEYIPGRQSIFRNTFTGSYEDAAEELNALLEDAVRLRMISDVPLGAFLSNGVDSSLITAKMQKLSDTPVKTFTVGFREPAFDESQAAEKVAQYLGTEHETRVLSVDEGKRLLGELPGWFDEPMADPSQIATLLVSAMARERVTVALSGDGGDELFCGYNTYAHFEKLKRLKSLSGCLNAAERLLPLREAGERANNRTWVKLFHLTSDEEIIDADLYTWWDRYRGIAGGAANPGVFQSAMIMGTTLSEKAMLHDLGTYLPDDVLTKVDRASMAVSLETRAPLLDYRIVELALRLPLEFKLQNGNKKRILKDLLCREIPETLIGKKKMGFRIPFARWMREDYGDLIRRYFSDEFLRKQDLFDRRQLKKMQRAYEQSRRTDFAREVWTFLLFQLWYDHYVN